MMSANTEAKPAPEERDDVLVARTAELCNPFVDGLSEVTLMIRGPVASSVLAWNASLFTPIIQPILLEVVAHAAEGGSFEIAAIDCRLDAALPKSVRGMSRDAGKKVIRGLLAPKGDRLIERYRTAVIAGDAPGHLAIIHALRASLFHLPPHLMMAAYLYQEGVGAGLHAWEISRFLIGSVIGADAPQLKKNYGLA